MARDIRVDQNVHDHVRDDGESHVLSDHGQGVPCVRELRGL